MFILFFLLWVTFNGKMTLEIALFGLVLAAVMVFFCCKFLGYRLKMELLLFVMAGPFLQYLGVLFIEILKANWCVIKYIFNSRDELDPVLVHFDVPLKSKFARVVLANSITLTPGTITANLDREGYTVHCLDRELGVGIDQSVFVKLLMNMEAKADRILGSTMDGSSDAPNKTGAEGQKN